MAGNKFATMLHKNCHKTIVILVYAFLEWILILLLLANSLFSHLISKFAAYFGLKPSCSWCSRLDHILCSDSHRERRHVCEAHGAEISKMAYCSNHSRLAESTNMCRNCSSPTPTDEISSVNAWFAWVREGAPVEGGEDQNRRCSCCDEILGGNSLRPPSFVFKPTWDVLNYYCMQKKGCIAEVVDLETKSVGKSLCDEADQKKHETKMQVQSDFTYESTDDPLSSLGCNEDDDESLYIADMLLQNAEYTDSDRFICIELIDTAPKVDRVEEEDDDDDEDEQVSSVEIHSEKADLLPTQNDEYKSNSEAAEIEGVDNSPEKEVEEEKHPPGVVITDSLDSKTIEKVEPVMEDSFDGSIASEVEAEDESLMTTEQLRTKVRAQQKALNALYAELEEERRAAAEAASQTMAMITKVQGEKAAMQMEALQYQRMMEEQAEYDQEALQLLNDLMVKRDKEKQHLEKELEMCQNQVSELLRSRNGSGTQSITLIPNCEDDLDIHHDQNLADPFEDPEEMGAEFTPDFSLAEFDEERLSILDEVKALEAKVLASLNGDEAELSEDGTTKKLLPLFDAANEEEEAEGERKVIVMHEELVHVYERLQALEADKEFLKHCIRSMMKGNKGLPLLHEILQHLRGLRSVEIVSDEIPLQDTSNLISDLARSV